MGISKAIDFFDNSGKTTTLKFLRSILLDDDTHAALNFLGVNKEYEGKWQVPEY